MAHAKSFKVHYRAEGFKSKLVIQAAPSITHEKKKAGKSSEYSITLDSDSDDEEPSTQQAREPSLEVISTKQKLNDDVIFISQTTPQPKARQDRVANTPNKPSEAVVEPNGRQQPTIREDRYETNASQTNRNASDIAIGSLPNTQRAASPKESSKESGVNTKQKEPADLVVESSSTVYAGNDAEETIDEEVERYVQAIEDRYRNSSSVAVESDSGLSLRCKWFDIH